MPELRQPSPRRRYRDERPPVQTAAPAIVKSSPPSEKDREWYGRAPTPAGPLRWRTTSEVF